jgi:hypothetical protein
MDTVATIRAFASRLASGVQSTGKREVSQQIMILEDVFFARYGVDPVDPDFDIKTHDAKHKCSPVVDLQPPPMHGVCDSPEQFARRYALSYALSTECVVHFCRVLRADQPCSYGWSWMKRGPYVGEFKWREANIEDLFEANGRHGRPRIDEQYVFSLASSFASDFERMVSLRSLTARPPPPPLALLLGESKSDTTVGSKSAAALPTTSESDTVGVSLSAGSHEFPLDAAPTSVDKHSSALNEHGQTLDGPPTTGGDSLHTQPTLIAGNFVSIVFFSLALFCLWCLVPEVFSLNIRCDCSLVSAGQMRFVLCFLVFANVLFFQRCENNKYVV